ncbi:MAG: pyrroline-5-carboxylate reductase [Candidatus Omnitrophica bacterium]|nr:pyrroline-5-carboxylate reductase [Candidatus Omnitrophota bacterium]MBU4346126.1 pyrroline-5-carboxylate reductase [Candidatus Omnitrophota bacterium]MBU4473575.1 pyrroline-5-carboxylate reductase [Candidatus Omnitrophota bacterium]MCG2706292.1 pyrroline-5-carboxylate reductase [Candidatus Omnitrophota bacterium]
MKKTIGIIGFGNMGSVISEGIKSKHRLWVFDKDRTKTKSLSEINVANNLVDLVNKVDAVILAVKPQDFDDVLEEIKKYLIKDKLIVSIAAGISTRYIERTLGDVRVVRVMPNMGIKVGHGISCLSKGKFATEKDFDFAEELFDYMGKTLRIEEEKMAAVTAVSGSGPGFYFDSIESILAGNKNPEEFTREFIISLTRAAEESGLKHEEAVFIASGTGNACQLLLAETKIPPLELKKQITSKGGTTLAGLDALHATGSLIEAVKAAKKRAEELSKKE